MVGILSVNNEDKFKKNRKLKSLSARLLEYSEEFEDDMYLASKELIILNRRISHHKIQIGKAVNLIEYKEYISARVILKSLLGEII